MSVAGRRIASLFAGPGLLCSGINHFVMPRTYVAMMPDYLPAHRELVQVSGVTEILSGLGAMHPRTRRAGGLLGMATLVAVFPANVHMAVHPERYSRIPRWCLYARLPVQAWMLWAVWSSTQRTG